MKEKLKWADMGARERLFAAHFALMVGQCIAFAEACAVYYPRRDVVAFEPDGHLRFVTTTRYAFLTAGRKVDCGGSESVQRIRATLPGFFPSDQAVLDTVLGDGDKP